MSTEFKPREREMRGMLFMAELPKDPRSCAGCYFAGESCDVEEMECWTTGPAIIWVRAQEGKKA